MAKNNKTINRLKLVSDVLLFIGNKIAFIICINAIFFLKSFGQANNTYYRFINNYPNNKSLFWGGNDAMTNGVTHDNNNWYFTTLGVCNVGDDIIGLLGCTPGKPNGNWSIRKIPVGQDLVTGSQTDEWVSISEPALANYGHAGDLDHFKHNGVDYLAVPITGGIHPAIAFFSTNPIKYINYEYIITSGIESIGWCAVHPINGDLYTSNDDASAIFRYKIDWATLLIPNWHYSLIPDDHAYPLQDTFHNMQGGEFTADGKLLYVNCGIIDCTVLLWSGGGPQHFEDGINVFETSETSEWKVIQHSTNQATETNPAPHSPIRHPSTGFFDYTFDNTGCSGEEPEGLTIWDLDDGRAPNINGQLHVISYNHNNFFLPGGDDNRVYLKHYERMNPYDECSMALTLNACDNINVTNDLATNSTSVPAITGYSGNIKDVWFKIIPPYSATSSFSIETYQVAGGLTHTVMQVLSGTCGHLKEIASDNGSSNGGHAKITIANNHGRDPLYIRVTDYGGNSYGKFGISYKITAAGSNIFSNVQTASTDNSVFTMDTVLAGDVNGDQRSDVIFVGKGASNNLAIKVKLGNADGTFTELPQQNFSDGSGVLTNPVLTGDVDGDGKTDLIFMGRGWDGHSGLCVRVKQGTRDGTFTALAQQNFSDGADLFSHPALTGDVDGDGKTDLIFTGRGWAGHSGLCVRVKQGTRDGTFTALAQQNFSDGADLFSHPVLTGDVDGDKRTDLIFTGKGWAGHSGLCIRVKQGTRDGTFTALAQQNFSDGADLFSHPVLTGDVDGDKRTDLIFTGKSWAGHSGLCIRVKQGTINGTFTTLPQQNFSDGADLFNYPVLVGDINADGYTDIIFVGQNWTGCGLNIRVKFSKGDGTWCSSWQVMGDGDAVFTNMVLVADINNDHQADLVFSFTNSTNNLFLRTKLSNGDYSCNPSTPSADGGVIQPQTDFVIYPNPTSNYFQIKTENSQIVQIRLINSQGVVVKVYSQFNTDIDRIDMGLLQNGIYFVEILNTATGQRNSRKIVKIN